MGETLTDCLIRMREDLSQVKNVREFLDSNQESQGSCSVTWRTIEALNSVLAVCSSQSAQEMDALDTFLDSFYFLARNNEEASVWSNFGFEMGIICVKTLTVIEQTDKFEVLFCKLLTVIKVICEHGPDVWKATARQILNVFINKKLSFTCFEMVLKLYICILRKIDPESLHNFSVQNLHLLKTLSMLVHKVGDFEAQTHITETVLLHLSHDKKIFWSFFADAREETRKLFRRLEFTDFEEDCRTFLNSMNKNRAGLEKKVYSICCHVLYFGGSVVDPPPGRKFIWVDANKESRRLTIQCAPFQTDVQRVVQIQFADITTVQLEHEEPDGSFHVTIRTTNLKEISQDEKNEDVLCVALEQENTREAILGFVNFLEHITAGDQKRKFGKVSRTKDCLLIDRSFALEGAEASKSKEEVQDNAISSSVKSGVDVLSLFEKPQLEKCSLEVANTQEKPLPCSFTPPQDKSKRDFALESRELTPNSFLESLNKHLGMPSPDVRHAFEDSTETVQFLYRSSDKQTHKLFRSPVTIFDMLESEEKTSEKPNFIFGENKENEAPSGSKEAEDVKPVESVTTARVLRNRKTLVPKLSNTQSQDYFRENSKPKKKPTLPRLTRKKKGTKNTLEGRRPSKKKTDPERKEKKQERPETRPSLLDPNGYAFQRWLKPTTSERSNFWLRKLEENQKQKEVEHVFDFEDEDDSDGKNKKRKKKDVPVTKKRDASRKFAPKENLNSLGEKKKKLETANEVEEPGGAATCDPEPEPEREPEREADPEEEDDEYESLPSSDCEKSPATQKRDLSESDNSVTRGRVLKKRRFKKRSETSLLSFMRTGFRQADERTRQQTEEIIQTVAAATVHVFNHLQKSQTRAMLSYMDAAEEAAAAFRENNDLELRVRRAQKMVTYFKSSCSASEYCDSVDVQISRLREAAAGLARARADSAKIRQAGDRLKAFIVSEIDKSFREELDSDRERLLELMDSDAPTDSSSVQ